jgi:hypothetical protein
MPLNVDKISTGSLNVNGTEINKNGGLPYKIYTALLTQSGGDDPQEILSGVVEVGVSYYFVEEPFPDPQNYDFSNIGGPKYPEQFPFVATSSDTPNNWGGYSLFYNTGAPVVTVLENTIGNIWWAFPTAGSYVGYLPDTLLTEGKQIILSIPYSSNNGTSAYYMSIQNNDVDGEVSIITSDGTSFVDIGFNNFPIEIRVYN